MKVVYRYESNALGNIFSIVVPINSKTLHCNMKDEKTEVISVWCLVDPDEKLTETKTFRICGTGHQIKTGYDLTYINTIHTENKIFWYHFFEYVS